MSVKHERGQLEGRDRLSLLRTHEGMKRNLWWAVEANWRTDYAQTPVGVELKIANAVKAFGILLRQLGQDECADSRETHLASVRVAGRSEEHTSELQSRPHLVCRLLLEKKKNKKTRSRHQTTLNNRKLQY